MPPLLPYQERLEKHLSPEARAAIMRQWAIERYIRPALWRGGFIGHLPHADFQDYLQCGTALGRVRVEELRARPFEEVRLQGVDIKDGVKTTATGRGYRGTVYIDDLAVEAAP